MFYTIIFLLLNDQLHLIKFNKIHRYWTEDGICWARNSKVRDVDDTSMAFRLLRLHGYDVSAGKCTQEPHLPCFSTLHINFCPEFWLQIYLWIISCPPLQMHFVILRKGESSFALQGNRARPLQGSITWTELLRSLFLEKRFLRMPGHSHTDSLEKNRHPNNFLTNGL